MYKLIYTEFMEKDRGRENPYSRVRFIVMLLVFAVLVFSSALIVFPLNRALMAAMVETRDALILKAEEYTGCKIEYASMGPSILSGLDIRNLRMLRDDGSELLSVSRLRLSYSLPALLRGKIQDIFRSASIDKPHLNLDFEKDAPLLKLFSGGEKSAGNLAAFMEILPQKFHIRVRNGEWAALFHPFDFGINNLNLDISIQNGGFNFDGDWNTWGGVDAPVLGENGFQAEMAVKINGGYSDGGRAVVTIPSLSGGFLKLKPLSFSLNFEDGILKARKVYDRVPADFSLDWNTENNELSAAFFGEDFLLRDFASLSGSWKASWDTWLDTRLSGKFSLKKSAEGGVFYNMDLRGDFPGAPPLGKGGFVLLADGNGEKINFLECSMDSSSGRLSYSGGLAFKPLAPDGRLSIENFGLGGIEIDERINADFYVSTHDGEITVFAENLTAGNVTLSALDASFFMEEDGLSFSFSALRFKELETYGQVRMSRLALEGSLDYEPRYIRANLNLDSFSTRDMAELIRPVSAYGDLSAPVLGALDGLSVTTEVFFNADYENILYNAPRFVAVYEGGRDVLAIASLSGTGRRFELDQGNISWAGGTAGLSGFADFSNPNDISFSFQTSLGEFTYYAEGSFLDRNSLSLQGSYGFHVYLSSAGMSSWSGYAGADHVPIPSSKTGLLQANSEGRAVTAGGQPAMLSFLVSLRYESPSFWSAGIDRFEITGIPAPGSSTAVFTFNGNADEKGLAIRNLYYDDRMGGLAGELFLGWDEGYKNFNLSAEVRGAGEERYNIEASYTKGAGAGVFLSGEKIQISRFADSNNAVVSGNLNLDWESIEKFRAEADLNSLVMRFGSGNANISAKAVIDENEFILSDLKALYGGIEAGVPYIKADRVSGLAETKAEIRGALQGRGVDLEIQGGAEFGALESWFNISGIADSLKGSLSVDRAHYDVFEAEEPFGFVFSSLRDENGRRISLSGGPRNMIRFRYSPEENSNGGNFYAALSSPSPVRGSFTGYVDSENIDAQTSDLYVDLGMLWSLLPPEDTIAFPGGIANGSIRIAGSLKDPDFYGTIRGTSVRIQVPQFITGDIRPVPVTVKLTGNEMSFGPLEAVVGEGRGYASAWFRFDGWIPNIFSIDIKVSPENAVPFGFDIAGVITRGTVSGDLNLSMENLILSISGDLTAQNAEISVDAEEIAAAEGGGWSNEATVLINANLNINTGRRVEFFWPSVEFPVLQAQADLGTGIHIAVDEAARTYSLTGDVRLRSGEIFYLERNFYIREGTLVFKETETQFDPRISARAELRDQGAEGPVTISMIIDNAPLNSFTPRFESNPALSQLEIFSFLGQNPQDDSSRSRNVLLSGGMDAITQFAMIRRLQKEVRDFLNLDMFSVRTQVLQNMVFQAAGFNDETSTDNPASSEPRQTNRAGNYFDNTTLFFGKYLGADIFGRALFSFRYDETKETWGGMTVEPEIGLEMRNPVFDIQFNMAPLNMENWFIDAISFTLTKRWSF